MKGVEDDCGKDLSGSQQNAFIAIVNKLDVNETNMKTKNTVVKTGIAAVMIVVEETTDMVPILLSKTGTWMMNISDDVVNTKLSLFLLTTSFIILSIYKSSLNLMAWNGGVTLVIATIFRVTIFLEGIPI